MSDASVCNICCVCHHIYRYKRYFPKDKRSSDTFSCTNSFRRLLGCIEAISGARERSWILGSLFNLFPILKNDTGAVLSRWMVSQITFCLPFGIIVGFLKFLLISLMFRVQNLPSGFVNFFVVSVLEHIRLTLNASSNKVFVISFHFINTCMCWFYNWFIWFILIKDI